MIEFRLAARSNVPPYLQLVEQVRQALRMGLLEAGGNIYYLAKLFFTDQKSFQYVAAIMTGSTQEEYAAMMLKGGRRPEGNRYKKDWKKKRG